MVKTVDRTLIDSAVLKKPPLVVELVGPAGAGKTTVFRALSQLSESILVSVQPFVRSVVDSPFFLRQSLLLMPTLLRMYKNKNSGRCLTRQEITCMAILNGWHNVLRRVAVNGDKVLLIDQGPVFLLAQLHKFGPESLRGRCTEKWWKGVYRQWATTLDMVVWLDTLDAYLLERIRARDKWHLMKDKSKPEVLEFLEHYRIAYQQVISMLAANQSRLKVLVFDTARESLEVIVNRLMVEFGLEDGEGEVVR
jgi:hypothetical protein